MIFPSRSELASKQIRRTGRAEAVTKEGLAATLLPGRQPDQMGQRHSLRPVRPRSCPGPLRNGSLCCISTPMWALPFYVATELNANPRDLDLYARRQPTLSAHLERVREHLGLAAFDEKARQRLAPFLFKEAFRLEQGAALVSRCEEYLRGQRPPLRRVPAQPQSRAKRKAGDQEAFLMSPAVGLFSLAALVALAGELTHFLVHDELHQLQSGLPH